MDLEFSYRFEAAHRFTSSASPKCATPHGHTWVARLILGTPPSTTSQLNSNQMLEEFTKLKSAWKSFIEETADHSFFHHHQDPLLLALKETIPNFRGLPFPGDPTTELISLLFYLKAESILKPLLTNHPQSLLIKGIEIQETPTNSVRFIPKSSLEVQELLSSLPQTDFLESWWSQSDLYSRTLKI